MSETFCWLPPESDCTGCSDRRHPDAQALASSSTVRRSRPAPEEAEPPEPAEDLDRRVRADAQDREQRLARPVAAEQHDARAERRRAASRSRAPARRRTPCRRSARRRRARGGTAPGRCPRRPRSRGSRPLPTSRSTGPNRSPCRPETASRTSRLDARALPVGKRELERPPDHQRDEALLGHGGRLERPLADAVAEHGDPVGDAEDLRQSVADVDDADAGAALLEHERMEALDVVRPERGRRLVEEQHLRLGEERLDDLEELPLDERERAASSRSAGCRGRTRRASRQPTPPSVRISAGAPAAPRDRGSRRPTGRGRASTSGRRCRGRAGGSPPGRPAGAACRRSRRSRGRARESRWRSRAMSTSRTRSPRRARGSRPPGSRR